MTSLKNLLALRTDLSRRPLHTSKNLLALRTAVSPPMTYIEEFAGFEDCSLAAHVIHRGRLGKLRAHYML